jgi:MYXO-CTERM domain-containing protein
VKVPLTTAAVLALALLVAAPVQAEVPHRGPNACATRPNLSLVGQAPRRLPASAPRVIYLNKNGGTYNMRFDAANPNRAWTNSATNDVTSVIMIQRGCTAQGDGCAANETCVQQACVPTGTRTLSAASSTFNWPQILQCVKDYYAPFNLTVTDVQPSSGTYLEAAVAGSAAQMGFDSQSGILGIAAADNFCSITETGIAFALANEHLEFQQYKDDELCNTVVHEVGHLLGLEHEQLHDDEMCYDFDPLNKEFLDQDAPCGEYDTDQDQAPRACTCGGSTTNSRDRLITIVGLSNPETTPPVVNITSPADGAKVPAGFGVDATATDNDQVSSVTLYVDNVMSAVDVVAPYHLSAPANLAGGPHDVVVEAKDRSGNTGRDSITIEVGTGCDCGDGYTCVDNSCRLNDGGGCDQGTECAGGICAGGGPDGNFCTEECDLTADSCPQGFACVAVGNTSVCGPSGDPNDGGGDGGDGGCGCAVGARNDLAGGAFGLAGLGLFGFLLLRRRRR